MRAGRGSQAVGHLDDAGHAGAEADAVVGAGNVVVHGLRDGDHFYAFLKQAHAVAQRVIAADGNQVIDSQPVQVLQHLGSQIISVVAVGLLQVRRNIAPAHSAGIGSRGVKKCAAGAAGAIDQFFREMLVVVAVVVVFVADHVDQACPSAPQPNDFVALAQRPDGDRADRRIQSRHVAASGQNSDDALFSVTACHD